MHTFCADEKCFVLCDWDYLEIGWCCVNFPFIGQSGSTISPTPVCTTTTGHSSAVSVPTSRQLSDGLEWLDDCTFFVPIWLLEMQNWFKKNCNSFKFLTATLFEGIQIIIRDLNVSWLKPKVKLTRCFELTYAHTIQRNPNQQAHVWSKFKFLVPE